MDLNPSRGWIRRKWVVHLREGREGEKIKTFKTVQLLFSSKPTTDVNPVKVCTHYFFNKGLWPMTLGPKVIALSCCFVTINIIANVLCLNWSSLFFTSLWCLFFALYFFQALHLHSLEYLMCWYYFLRLIISSTLPRVNSIHSIIF